MINLNEIREAAMKDELEKIATGLSKNTIRNAGQKALSFMASKEIPKSVFSFLSKSPEQAKEIGENAIHNLNKLRKKHRTILRDVISPTNQERMHKKLEPLYSGESLGKIKNIYKK